MAEPQPLVVIRRNGSAIALSSLSAADGCAPAWRQDASVAMRFQRFGEDGLTPLMAAMATWAPLPIMLRAETAETGSEGVELATAEGLAGPVAGQRKPRIS